MDSLDFYRTDLVDESEEMVRHRTAVEKNALGDAQGVIFEESREGRIRLTEVKVDAQGAERIGKKEGNYVTLTIPSLTTEDQEEFTLLSEMLIKKLDEMLVNVENIEKGKILFVGLGNRDVTPDAIGPLAVDKLRNLVPEYYSAEGSEVFVYAPGVTIQAGLETSDFIKALAAEIKPDLLIVIDALAARDSSRLCKTIQITDTGIHPGSGVGNNRKEISFETLGMPALSQDLFNLYYEYHEPAARIIIEGLPVDETWDAFIAEWRQNGGDEMIAEMTKWVQENKQ